MTENFLLENEKVLSERIKQFESAFDQRLDPSKPFVIRVDGVAFRTFTRGFEKPFDQRLTRSFIRTASDLLQRFNPSTIYYASDEISLVFNSCSDSTTNDEHHREHFYSGRVEKLVSVVASFTAAKFNQYINEEDWSNLTNENVRQRIANHSAYFDARVFSLPDDFNAMLSLFWRHRFDTIKNATSSYALSFFSPSQIHGKHSGQLRQMMIDERQFDMFHDAPKNIIYGTFLKKEIYDLPAVDRKTGETVTVERTRIRIGSFDFHELLPTVDEKINFIRNKYWNQGQLNTESVPVDEWWKKFYPTTGES